jgi:hypothetical protein
VIVRALLERELVQRLANDQDASQVARALLARLDADDQAVVRDVLKQQRTLTLAKALEALIEAGM